MIGSHDLATFERGGIEIPQEEWPAVAPLHSELLVEIAIIGGISAMLIGTAFLVAAYIHWRSYAKFSLTSTIDHQSAPPNCVAIHAVG